MYPKNSIMDAGIQVCVIASGGKDLPNDKSCNMKIYSPLEHSPDGVDLNHLAFSPMIHSPTAMSQQSFMGNLDPGTMVYVLKTSGQSGGLILGQANDIYNGGTSPGNFDLMSNPIIQQLMETTRNVNVPPNIVEKKVNGATVKQIQEKGEQWSHGLLKGLPTHGALFDMSGFRMPDLKNVPTAKQTNTQMMTSQMMEQLGGQVMSLGSMFAGLKNKGSGGGGNKGGSVNPTTSNDIAYGPTYMDQIMDSGLSPQMQDAINSLSLLIQGQESEGGVRYVTGGVVHEETYLENARDLLSQADSLEDVMYVLQRLQWDDTLRGTEKLEKVTTEIETAWGTALQEVDYEGNIVVTYVNPPSNGEVTYAQTKILISSTGLVTDYKKIAETEDETTWVGTLTNLAKTSELSNGDIILADALDGSIGTEQTWAQDGVRQVERIVDDTTIIFRTTGGSVPIVGNVANVSWVTVEAVEVGKPAQAVFYNTMNSPQASPAIGSIPSGGGAGAGFDMGMIMGMFGMMQNMFGRSAGTMQDMYKRLAPTSEQETKQMHQKLNNSRTASKLTDVSKKTTEGGDPTNQSNYKAD